MSAFAKGSRGFLISRFQKALGISSDGVFGANTESALLAFQSRFPREANARKGIADETTFDALGLSYPSLFERCLNLTGEFEGTGFGGVNSRDIDGAGVTLGIAGFTTKHGEVQKLFIEYYKRNKFFYEALTLTNQKQMLELVRTENPNQKDWDSFFYTSLGYVKEELVRAVKIWGADEVFQTIQKQLIYRGMFVPAVTFAHSLGLRTEAGIACMFDVQVQNGGWREAHLAKYKGGKTELEKLVSIANAVAQSSVAKWQNDVLTRKLTFAKGSGVVHGRSYDIRNYGFQIS